MITCPYTGNLCACDKLEKASCLPLVTSIIEEMRKSTPQQPSVSPEVGGVAPGRQRHPKDPGIPHFRIRWHPITRLPWYIPLNLAGNLLMIKTIGSTTGQYLYYRSGFTARLKPKNP